MTFSCSTPRTAEPELVALTGVTIHRNPELLTAVSFALVFARSLAEVEVAAGWLPGAVGDAVIWFAYPKKTSKRFRCDFNRDTGWAAVGAAGFESVRQVAIDEDWSALRFRRTEYVKTLTRAEPRAVSPSGKARVKKKGKTD